MQISRIILSVVFTLILPLTAAAIEPGNYSGILQLSRSAADNGFMCSLGVADKNIAFSLSPISSSKFLVKFDNDANEYTAKLNRRGVLVVPQKLYQDGELVLKSSLRMKLVEKKIDIFRAKYNEQTYSGGLEACSVQMTGYILKLEK